MTPGADTINVRPGTYVESVDIDDADPLEIKGIGIVTVDGDGDGSNQLDAIKRHPLLYFPYQINCIFHGELPLIGSKPITVISLQRFRRHADVSGQPNRSGESPPDT